MFRSVFCYSGVITACYYSGVVILFINEKYCSLDSSNRTKAVKMLLLESSNTGGTTRK